MKDLITAIGLLFFIEGLLVAMFPSRIKNMLLIINKIPETKLRKSGLLFLGIGFFIVWYIVFNVYYMVFNV